MIPRRELDALLLDLGIAIEAGAEAYHENDDTLAAEWSKREQIIRQRIDVALDHLYLSARLPGAVPPRRVKR